MRGAMIGAAGGVLALVGWLMAEPRTDVSASRAASRQAGTGLVSFQVPAGDKGVHLYIVDERCHWFGVYKLDLESGNCELKVARDFSGDVKLLEVGAEHDPPVQAVKNAVSRQRRD